MTKQRVGDQLAATIATFDHVERTRYLGGRIMVQYPRELGGKVHLTLNEAKRFIERYTSFIERYTSKGVR